MLSRLFALSFLAFVSVAQADLIYTIVQPSTTWWFLVGKTNELKWTVDSTLPSSSIPVNFAVTLFNVNSSLLNGGIPIYVEVPTASKSISFVSPEVNVGPGYYITFTPSPADTGRFPSLLGNSSLFEFKAGDSFPSTVPESSSASSTATSTGNATGSASATSSSSHNAAAASHAVFVVSLATFAAFASLAIAFI